MKPIKLTASPQRVLPIELPSGETVNFTLKRITLKVQAKVEQSKKELDEKISNGEITTLDYINSLWGYWVEEFDNPEFDKAFLDNLEMGHVTLIGSHGDRNQ